MILNRISIKNIIAKVIADNDIDEDTLRINDMIEWAAEAVSRIGAFVELDTTITGKGGEPELEVSNYQAELPSDLVSIIQVAFRTDDDTIWCPMRSATGSFDSVRGITTSEEDDDGNVTYDSEEEQVGETSYASDYVYSLKPGYITCNVETGYIMMAYRSTPLDDDGFPYIPDDPGFEDAVYWYITMKLLYPKWATGKVRDAVYYNARNSWNYYSKQAYGNSMMPNADALESIKNTWLRLVPEIDEHSAFYSTVGQQQEIYNQNNRYATNYNARAKWWL